MDRTPVLLKLDDDRLAVGADRPAELLWLGRLGDSGVVAQRCDMPMPVGMVSHEPKPGQTKLRWPR